MAAADARADDARGRRASGADATDRRATCVNADAAATHATKNARDRRAIIYSGAIGGSGLSSAVSNR
jgi:hypothetical protein